jgi:DNA-binding transcriptional ArsR family regulator
MCAKLGELSWVHAMRHARIADDDTEVFDRQAAICKAFAHSLRLRVLDLLENGECGFSDLQGRLGISKANLSQHVAVLKSAGVLVTRRQGKQVFLALAIPEIKQACHLIRKVLRIQIRKQRHLAG